MDFWTDERVERLLDFRRRGMTGGEIALALGVSRNAVIGKLDRLNIGGGMHAKPSAPAFGHRPSHGPRDRFEFTAEHDRTIIECKRGGVSNAAIARSVGCTRGQLDARAVFLRKAGLLTAQAPEIVLLQGTASVRRVANAYGAKVNRLQRIAPRKALPQPPEDSEAPPPATDAGGAPITMANVGAGQCRWPLGEVGAPHFRLCGNDADTVYCPHHTRLSVERRTSAGDVFPPDGTHGASARTGTC
jgi:hypothetical protein